MRVGQSPTSMRKQTFACTTECDWSRHLALLADKACGESFQKQPKSQNRQNVGQPTCA